MLVWQFSRGAKDSPLCCSYVLVGRCTTRLRIRRCSRAPSRQTSWLRVWIRHVAGACVFGVWCAEGCVAQFVEIHCTLHWGACISQHQSFAVLCVLCLILQVLHAHGACNCAVRQAGLQEPGGCRVQCAMQALSQPANQPASSEML
jgi:hypothetical protein